MKTNAAKRWPASVVKLPGILSKKDVMTNDKMEIEPFLWYRCLRKWRRRSPQLLACIFWKSCITF